MWFAKLSIRHPKKGIGVVVIFFLVTQISCVFFGDTKPSKPQPVPIATRAHAVILPTRFFLYQEGNEVQKVSFKVPEAGAASANIQIETTSSEHANQAKITINSKSIVPKNFVNNHSIDVPVMLREGENELIVVLKEAARVKRIAIRIDAPLNRVRLMPIPDPVVPAHDSFKAQAIVTGLGVPIPGAKVKFTISGLDKTIEKSADSGDNGVATVLLGDLTAGVGKLRAEVLATHLSATVKIHVAEKATLNLEPTSSQVTVPVKSTGTVNLTVTDLSVGGKERQFSITYNPVVSGVAAKFPELVVTKAGGSAPIRGTLKGLTPGIYTLLVMATSKSTRQSAIAEIHVSVREPFVLNMPSAIPSGLPLRAAPTKVIFRTLVTDAPKPAIILLDEVDSQGKLLANRSAIAELRDDGKGADGVAGDGFYSGTYTVDIAGDIEKGIATDGESEKFYQLRIPDTVNGKSITSAIMSLPISTLPLVSRPSDPNALVHDNQSQDRFYSNEVIVVATPGVSFQRIREVIADADKSFVIVGFLPSLRMYLLELPNNKGAEGVRKAVAALTAYAEVKSASPNFEISLAAPYEPGDPRFPTHCVANGFGAAADCQYYLQAIRADAAWTWLKSRDPNATFGSNAAKVAVIDNGIDFAHSDLVGTNDPSIPGSNNGAKSHGTEVAGLIAAQHNNSDIAGIAPNTKLIPYPSSNTWTAIGSFVAALQQEVKIINLSMQPTSGGTDMITAVCQAICSNRLVVTAAGNRSQCQSGDVFPARYNETNFIQCTTNISPTCTNPISIDQGMLAVGATDLDMDGDGIIDSQDSDDDNDGIPDSNEAADNDGVNNNGVIAANMDGTCSNVKPWVDIYAPGEQIATTTVGGDVASVSGTSYSTPLVSGAAALLWAAYPNWSVRDVETCLRSQGQELDLIPQVHPELVNHTESEILSLVGSARFLDVYASLNHAPTKITLDNNSVAENTSGVLIGNLTTVNPCNTYNSTVNYSVTDNRFGIVSDQLVLNSPLDYESQHDIPLSITATDHEGLSYVETLTIAVTNVNEPPSISAIADQYILENTTSAPIAFTVSDIDTIANNLITTATSSNPAVISNNHIVISSGGNNRTVTITPTTGQQGTADITLTVNDGQYPQSTPFKVTVTDMNPIIAFDRKESYTGSDGNPYVRFRIPVVNWQVYPTEMFVTTSAYGPCGNNPTPSRSWVEIYNGVNNSRIYGFCALGTPNNLTQIWFAEPEGTAPPASVYIEVQDRSNGNHYRSNTLPIPYP